MKKYIWKSVVLVLTAILIILSILSTNVFAEEGQPSVTPRWSILYYMDLDIVFPAEGEGIVSASATGQSNVTSLEGTIRLYEYVNGTWVFMESFSNTSTYRSIVVDGTFETVRGRSYKAYFYITAYSVDDAERSYCKLEKTCP